MSARQPRPLFGRLTTTMSAARRIADQSSSGRRSRQARRARPARRHSLPPMNTRMGSATSIPAYLASRHDRRSPTVTAHLAAAPREHGQRARPCPRGLRAGASPAVPAPAPTPPSKPTMMSPTSRPACVRRDCHRRGPSPATRTPALGPRAAARAGFTAVELMPMKPWRAPPCATTSWPRRPWPASIGITTVVPRMAADVMMPRAPAVAVDQRAAGRVRRAGPSQMRMTRAISDVRPVRSGPPTTATEVRLANTPPLHVRPTATARCPTFGLGGRASRAALRGRARASRRGPCQGCGPAPCLRRCAHRRAAPPPRRRRGAVRV